MHWDISSSQFPVQLCEKPHSPVKKLPIKSGWYFPHLPSLRHTVCDLVLAYWRAESFCVHGLGVFFITAQLIFVMSLAVLLGVSFYSRYVCVVERTGAALVLTYQLFSFLSMITEYSQGQTSVLHLFLCWNLHSYCNDLAYLCRTILGASCTHYLCLEF